MSLALNRKCKELETALRTLENRVLMLEMQKRPVEAIGRLDPIAFVPKRKTITLRGRASV